MLLYNLLKSFESSYAYSLKLSSTFVRFNIGLQMCRHYFPVFWTDRCFSYLCCINLSVQNRMTCNIFHSLIIFSVKWGTWYSLLFVHYMPKKELTSFDVDVLQPKCTFLLNIHTRQVRKHLNIDTELSQMLFKDYS